MKLGITLGVVAIALGVAVWLAVRRPWRVGGERGAGADDRWSYPPAERPPGVEHVTFFSGSMGREVGANVYLPPGYHADLGRRFPVVYHLPGMGDTESSHLDNVRVLDEAVRAGEVPPLILVYAFAGRASWFADSPDGTVMAETCVMRELIPFIEGRYRTAGCRARRGLEGWSMGGFGAMKLAFKYPREFASVVSLGGAFPDAEEMRRRYPNVFDKMFGGERRFEENTPAYWIRTNAERIRGHVAVMLAVGAGDELLASNRRLHALLREVGVAHEYEEVAGLAHHAVQTGARVGLKAFQFQARALGASGE